jgi:hypothetical protein
MGRFRTGHREPLIWNQRLCVIVGRSKPALGVKPKHPPIYLLTPALSFVRRTTAVKRQPGQQWEEDDGTTADPLADARAHRWVDAPPSSGSLVGPTCVRALTDPEVTTVLQLAATMTGSSTSGRRSSRARSGKWRLGIYPHGVWIRPQPAVVVMEISTPR